MARDYAPKSRSGRRKKGNGPAWGWLISGLLIGLFVAFLTYLAASPKQAPTRVPWQNPPAATAPTPATASKDTREVRKEPTPPPPPAPAKPRFDFYTILPELEVAIPEQELERRDLRESAKPETAPSAGYLLQVGAFQQAAEAESLKARLALSLGLQASVQTVTINNQAWYRVRLGPFKDVKTLNDTRARLQRHDIQAMVLEAKS